MSSYAPTLAALAGGALFLGYQLYNNSQRPNQQAISTSQARRNMSDKASQTATRSSHADDHHPFRPKPMDVLIVKAIIGRKGCLPVEIVDIIIDHAEYWPHSETTMEYTGRNKMRIKGSGRFKEDMFLLRSPPIGFGGTPVTFVQGWSDVQAPPEPLPDEFPTEHFERLLGGAPTLEHPVRKIVFRLRSHDQGSGGSPAHRGTFRHSYTWFEAGLERFTRRRTADADADENDNQQEQPQQEEEEETLEQPFDALNLRPIYPVPERSVNQGGRERLKYPLLSNQQYMIQCNRTASRRATDYEVTWSWRDSVDPESDEARQLEQQGRGKATATGDFVRNLKLGDVVTIWGKARFPAWVNNVEKVSVEVYWAV